MLTRIAVALIATSLIAAPALAQTGGQAAPAPAANTQLKAQAGTNTYMKANVAAPAKSAATVKKNKRVAVKANKPKSKVAVKAKKPSAKVAVKAKKTPHVKAVSTVKTPQVKKVKTVRANTQVKAKPVIGKQSSGVNVETTGQAAPKPAIR